MAKLKIMVKLYLFFSLISVLWLSSLSPKKIKEKFFNMRNIKTTSFKKQNKYCKNTQNNIKKCNNDITNINKMQKNKCAIKIKYIPLLRISVWYNTIKLKQNLRRIRCFCKNSFTNNYDLINKMSKIIKTNQNKYYFEKFRAFNQITFIENVANFLAIRCAKQINFKAIKFINSFKNTQKLYKKEEKVLYFLFLRAIYAKICILVNEILHAEKIVLKAKNKRKLFLPKKDNLYNCLFVYGQNIGKYLVENSINCFRCKKAINYFEELNGELTNSILWAKFLISKKFV